MWRHVSIIENFRILAVFLVRDSHLRSRTMEEIGYRFVPWCNHAEESHTSHFFVFFSCHISKTKGCYALGILLSWQRDVTTSPLYSASLRTADVLLAHRRWGTFPPLETFLSGDERGEMSAVRRLMNRSTVMFALSVAREYNSHGTIFGTKKKNWPIKVRKRRGVILLHFSLPTQKVRSLKLW